MHCAETASAEPIAPAADGRVMMELHSTARQEAPGLPAVPRVPEIERLIGLPRGQVSTGRVRQQIHLAIEQTVEQVRPRCVFRVLPVAASGGGEGALAALDAQGSRKLAETLGGSAWIVVLAVTVGAPIDEAIRRLSEVGKHFDAHVLDAAASAAVESLVEGFQQGVEAHVGRYDLGATLRFSPGYCDWEVTAQRALFGLLGQQPAGIELLPSCLMTPKKSITGVFGLYPLEDSGRSVSRPTSPCSACNLRARCRVRRG